MSLFSMINSKKLDLANAQSSYWLYWRFGVKVAWYRRLDRFNDFFSKIEYATK